MGDREILDANTRRNLVVQNAVHYGRGDAQQKNLESFHNISGCMRRPDYHPPRGSRNEKRIIPAAYCHDSA
jgi:hypothetical protein